MNQLEFARLLDLPISSLRSYEQGVRSLNEDNLLKITMGERTKKYALWLVCDEVAVDIGQIRPDDDALIKCGLLDAKSVASDNGGDADLGKKLHAIRLAEELSEDEFSSLTGISIGTLRKYESGLFAVKAGDLLKVTRNSALQKYSYWLTTGHVLPESGQICPDFSIQEQCGIIEKHTLQRKA